MTVTVTVAVAVACALLLGACGTTGSAGSTAAPSLHATAASRPATTRATASPATGSPPTASTAPASGAPTGGAGAQAVVSAWMAAEQAFDTAALDADPLEPALTATTMAPQLPWSEALLARMQASGEVARGPVQFGPVDVLSLGRSLATVRSCIHDAEVVVDADTGRPVPGEAGQADDELITSTMESTPAGWKLATQTVGVTRCAGR